MSTGVVIVDYGMGNLFSVKKVVERIGFSCIVTSSPAEVKQANRIILPGVGHFGKAMHNLKENGLYDTLQEAAQVKKTPIMGICLGMQLMVSHSEEGDAAGLGWIEGEVVKFDIRQKELYKVPHMGWNTVTHEKLDAKLFNEIKPDEEFYFVHSYHVVPEREADILSKTPYEQSFVSAIQRDNIVGYQFHPEKSHKAGEQLIRNFLMQ